MVDLACLGGILSAVRKVIFDWSPKLESAGIQAEAILSDELTRRRALEPAVINSVGKVENASQLAESRLEFLAAEAFLS